MDSGRLFDVDAIPEVPLFREPRRAKAARGATLDGRFKNDYPPDWNLCQTCRGIPLHAFVVMSGTGMNICGVRGCGKTIAQHEGWETTPPCPDCLGMGSLKASTRLLAGHRCERCRHPYVPKGDAAKLGVEPTAYHWSPCDKRCTHLGPVRMRETFRPSTYEWVEHDLSEHGGAPADFIFDFGPSGERIRRWEVEAEWRILTVHHLDGDKANCRWWNLAALCQICHLQVQGKVVMERLYPHPHTEWFRPHVAGYYAFVYLGEELTRADVDSRVEELLALELDPSYG